MIAMSNKQVCPERALAVMIGGGDGRKQAPKMLGGLALWLKSSSSTTNETPLVLTLNEAGIYMRGPKDEDYGR